MNLQKRWEARQKRLDYCRGRSSESPFCRYCGVSIPTGWQCDVCINAQGTRKLEQAHKLLVTGLKAAYHLALVCDTVPYNGYGHIQWNDYHRIQDWLDDNQPSVTVPMKDGTPFYTSSEDCNCVGCQRCGTHCLPGCISGKGVWCTAEDK